ncbi:MAG TPA: DUF2254 domain-containing protein [Planctomycetota bacterium]|nr:DUF2254 domain-containing protein [Planctomycetota bacterium]
MLRSIRHSWEALRTSFWFLPALMALGAGVLAFSAVRLDGAVPDGWADGMGWLYTGGPAGARQLLATVASSMITVAGVVFSMTVVALSMASSQFGPRLLRNFMRDKGNQFVLGTFISTFLYCLLVLRSVRDLDARHFVPHVSVTIAVLLALASLGVLIYFIHHVAVSMQAPQVIANVSEELHASIDALFPEELGQGADRANDRPGEAAAAEILGRDAHAVASRAEGYVQHVDEERLVAIATKRELVLRLELRTGRFVVRGHPLVLVRGGDPGGEVVDEIRDCFVFGAQPTPTQDVEFTVNQLVEVAVRALSPGINDPFTAMTCVDRLGAALCRLAGREFPSPWLRDGDGRLRVIADPPDFAEIADAAFRQIREHGRRSSAVLARMLETIAVVLAHARREDDRDALLRQAGHIEQVAAQLPVMDRELVEARYREVLDVASHMANPSRALPSSLRGSRHRPG